MLLGADDGLRAVGVIEEEHRAEGVDHGPCIAGQTHVVLLIDGLKLGMKAADDAVLEAIGLDLGPVLDLVRGDVLGVAGDVEVRVRVRARGADSGHQLVVLVGDGILRSLVADAIDLTIECLAFGLVGGFAIDFKKAFDLVEEGLFGLIVRRPEVSGALEHEVLKVVRQAGGLCWVVLSAYANGDISLDAGRLFVDAHVDLQAVVEGVDAGLQRVAVDRLIVRFCARTLAIRGGKHPREDDCQRGDKKLLCFHR